MTDRRALLILAASALLAPASGRAAGKKEAEGATADPFVALPTMTAAVIRPDGRRGVLTVQATLYAAAPPQQAKARQSLPRLLDAYVRALQGWTYRMGPGTLPNVDAMSQLLQTETDRLLGRGVRFLLGGVLVN